MGQNVIGQQRNSGNWTRHWRRFNGNAGIGRTKATEASAGGGAAQTANDSNPIRELVAKIETEQDQGRFTALVEDPRRKNDD
jgi:hypothetical protein